MEKEPFLSKTEHILYIYSNACYQFGKGDAEEFQRTLSLINSYRPISFYCNVNYSDDYIIGMYPEFKGALEEFASPIKEEVKRIKASPERQSRYKGSPIFPDEMLADMAAKIIKKYNLKESYDFSTPPTKEQMERLNHSFLPKQKYQMKEELSPALFHIGMALAEKCRDFRLVLKFNESADNAQRVASGSIEKEYAQKFMDIEGVPLGLDLLELREKGILDEELNIKDMDAFMKSKVMTKFKFEGKTYNLTQSNPQSTTINPGIIR